MAGTQVQVSNRIALVVPPFTNNNNEAGIEVPVAASPQAEQTRDGCAQKAGASGKKTNLLGSRGRRWASRAKELLSSPLMLGGGHAAGCFYFSWATPLTVFYRH